MNAPAALIGTTAESAAQAISQWGFVVTPEMLTQTARDIGETTILSRTGGAPTLAVGMAQILHGIVGGTGHDGVLVPLRDPVRGAVHPHHGRRRHARRRAS